MLPHEVPMGADHTAEVLRPRAIGGRAEHEVANPLRAQLLRDWGEPRDGLDLAGGEEAHRFLRRMWFPADVPARIETDVRHDTREKDVFRCALAQHRDSLAFQIAERLDACPPEHFEAADVDPPEHH